MEIILKYCKWECNTTDCPFSPFFVEKENHIRMPVRRQDTFNLVFVRRQDISILFLEIILILRRNLCRSSGTVPSSKQARLEHVKRTVPVCTVKSVRSERGRTSLSFNLVQQLNQDTEIFFLPLLPVFPYKFVFCVATIFKILDAPNKTPLCISRAKYDERLC